MDPEPKISSNLEKNDPYESDLTTDESDDDLQSSPFKPPPSRADDGLASGFAKNAKGIPSEPMDLHDDGLTASASDIDHSPAKTHLVPKSKPKLGRIGGKDKDSSPDSPAVLTTKPKLGKIGGKGKLGKSRGTGSVSSRNEGAVSNKREDPVSLKRETRDQTAVPRTLGPEAVGRMAQRPLEPSPPRETSQERANKKREQLKRELESKSHAATKKKRRF